MPQDIVPAAFIASIFVLYGLIAWRRKAKFRTLAPKLGGTFTEMGRFAPGKIVGSDFSVEAHTVGVGRSKRYFTTIKVTSPSAPSTYLLKAPFFENYPNWKYAKVMGTVKERVFFTAITLPRYLELTPIQRDAFLSWLARKSFSTKEFYDALKKNRMKEFVIEDASITTRFRGIVLNADRLRDSLATLRLLAH